MKKIIKLTGLILCFAILTSVFTSCIFGTLNGGNRYGPAMWVAEDSEGNIVYLMGSVHIGEKSMFPFCDEIEDAFEMSDALAVEYDIVKSENDSQGWTEEELDAYNAQFMIPDGKTVKDLIDPDIYESAKAYLTEKGYYTPEFDYIVPVMWSSAISQYMITDAGYSAEYGVDRYFINAAYDLGKEVIDIESEQSQIELLISEPVKVTEYNIKSSLAAKDALIGPRYVYGMMLDVYNSGDMENLEKMVFADIPKGTFDEETEKLYNEYMEKMYGDRNRVMADAVKQYLAEGRTVFLVVGAAHMMGDDGIIALLRSEGYTVYRK